MTGEFRLLIPCAAGAEGCVKRQLRALGYGDCPAHGGRVALTGGWADIARLNIWLRAGERVLIELARFRADTFDMLFEGIYDLPWEEYLSGRERILMDGKCVKSKLMAVKATGGVAKKALLKRLAERAGVTRFGEKGPRAVVGVSVLEDEVSVTLDTSGDGLHKRGYRTLAYEAPLKETTAAALLEYAYYRREKPFADVFCGSGTLPIEAALYACNIAPGLHRAFDFMHWHCAPAVLDRAREEAEDLRFRGVVAPVYGGDISPKAISIARYHAARADIAEHIEWKQADMRSFSSEAGGGVIVSNPPYGERLQESDLFGLYRDFSRMYRRLAGWDCVFLSAYPAAERAFGRADRKRNVTNAQLECRAYSYRGGKSYDGNVKNC